MNAQERMELDAFFASLDQKTEKYVTEVNKLHREVMSTPSPCCEYPLLAYCDDTFRINLLKSQNWGEIKRKQRAVSDFIAAKKQMMQVKAESMSASEILEWCERWDDEDQ